MLKKFQARLISAAGAVELLARELVQP